MGNCKFHEICGLTDGADPDPPAEHGDGNARAEDGRYLCGLLAYVHLAGFEEHLHPALRYMVGATCASGRSMPKSVSEWPMKRYPLGERYLQNLLRRLVCVALSK